MCALRNVSPQRLSSLYSELTLSLSDLALLQQFSKVTDAYDSVKIGQGPDAPIHLVSLISLYISLVLNYYYSAVQLPQAQKCGSRIRTLG